MRSADGEDLKMNDTRGKKEKNQHIQVFVRVRPVNSAEKSSKSPLVVEVPSNKDIVVKERPQDKLTKKFTFDKVFGPVSKQIDVYNAVVSPLLEEVLAGYNCTVFAYGQTGTGKTFTMEGSCNDPTLHWQSDSAAGIIPRALSHLFDELRTLGAQEYSVRVSFLELYNEELFDLLSPNDDASKIRIYEDASRKGAIIIHGLEEVTVHNKSEVYKILEKGSEKRQTAATLMNAHSSRSHTVFSITVHIKENTVDGEELLKTGKLNLVDLAGSENVGRSGAVDRRAREAGNINQSLLTLGRVITALVERAPHIPYRESKLTRLLQESLGGRTKTSIIATISPANLNIEETLSTLDYAHRAKNITNRPEINQKLSKKALLKEYTEEIERLRRDLAATRERNGVYLAQENYNEMQSSIEGLNKEIEEKINHIKVLEETMQNKEKIFTDLKTEFELTTNVLHETKEKLESTTNVLVSTKNELHETVFDRDLQKHLVEKHLTTEKTLLNQAQTLLNVADVATTDTKKLHEKINRKQKVEEENEYIGQEFRNEMLNRFQHIEEDLGNYTQEIVDCCSSLKNQINTVVAQQSEATDATIKHISQDLVKQEIAISDKLVENANTTYDEYHSWILAQIGKSSDMSQQERQALQNISAKISSKVRELVENKISENLKLLYNESNLKLMNLVNTINKSIANICDTSIGNWDTLTKQIDEMKETVIIAVENQNQVMKKEDEFSTKLDVLTSHFLETVKQYKDFSAEKKQCHTVITTKLNEIHVKSNDINERIVVNRTNDLKHHKAMEEEVEKQVKNIRTEVSSTLEQNWEIADNAITKSVDIINEVEGDINASRYALSAYNNSVEASAMELKHRAEKEKESLIAKAQEYHKVISDASTAHTHFMEEQRTASQHSFSEINYKLDSQSAGSMEWKNKLGTQLHSTHQKVEKFIGEELRKDVPTGSTPIRREFNYPRQLVATSPHERIIKRFRAVRKVVESSEDEGDSTMTNTPSPNINGRENGRENSSLLSPMPSNNSNVISSTPNSESKLKKIPVICSNYSLMKSASTSDIPLATKAQLDSTTMSESEVLKGQDNKENGAFIKPVKLRPKRLSKPKSGSRKVLGSYN